MLRCTNVEIINLLSLLGEEVEEFGISDALVIEVNPNVIALLKGRINSFDDGFVLHYYFL